MIGNERFSPLRFVSETKESTPDRISDRWTKMSELKLLLEAGADPNLPDENGETPEQSVLRSLSFHERSLKLKKHSKNQDLTRLSECYGATLS